MKPKAVFVGHPKIAEMLAGAWKQFEWVGSAKDLTEFQTGIRSGSLTNDFQLFFVMDNLFNAKDSSDTTFEKTVISLAPYCFIGIINYTEANNGLVDERIEKAAYYLKKDDPTLYFYIDRRSPTDSLIDALEQFKVKSKARDVVAILNGEEPPTEGEDEAKEDTAARFTDDLPKSDYLGQVVSITSSKGGSGKSTIAISIASYIAHASLASVEAGLTDRPLKVALVDFDTEAGHLGFATGFVKPNILTMVKEGVSEKSMAETAIWSEGLKVDLFLSPRRAKTAREIKPAFYSELISFLRLNYDYVILDTGSKYLDPLTAEVAYPMSNQIIFVSDIVITSIYGMAKWVDELTRDRKRQGLGLDRNKLAIIINRYMGDVNMPAETITQAAQDVKIIGAYPALMKIVTHANNIRQIELLLNNKGWRESTSGVAKAIVGNKWILSDNFTV